MHNKFVYLHLWIQRVQMHTETPAATLRYKVTRSLSLGELRLSWNHTVTEYEMSGEPYSQKSGWINHLNERIFQVMTFKKVFTQMYMYYL